MTGTTLPKNMYEYLCSLAGTAQPGVASNEEVAAAAEEKKQRPGAEPVSAKKKKTADANGGNGKAKKQRLTIVGLDAA